MAGVQKDITVYCGRDFYLNITNQTALNNPFSLANYVAVMTVKANINDPDSKALYQGPPWSANLNFGQLSFKIPHTTTGSWWKNPPSGSGAVSSVAVYDVCYADSASPRNWNTILYGGVNLQQPVTIVIPGG